MPGSNEPKVRSVAWPRASMATAAGFFSSRRRHTRWSGDWSSDVCSSDLEVFLLQIEDVLRRGRDADEIPAGRMLDALRLPCRAGRVQDEQWVRGVHRLGRTFGIRFRHQLVPPLVSSLPHGHLHACAPEDDDVLDEIDVRDCFVDNLLTREV